MIPGGRFLVLLLPALTCACFDWNKYDPRLGEHLPATSPLAPAKCAGLGLLADDFTDGKPEPQWRPYGSPVEGGGALTLTAPAGGSSGSGWGYV